MNPLPKGISEKDLQEKIVAFLEKEYLRKHEKIFLKKDLLPYSIKKGVRKNKPEDYAYVQFSRVEDANLVLESEELAKSIDSSGNLKFTRFHKDLKILYFQIMTNNLNKEEVLKELNSILEPTGCFTIKLNESKGKTKNYVLII